MSSVPRAQYSRSAGGTLVELQLSLETFDLFHSYLILNTNKTFKNQQNQDGACNYNATVFISLKHLYKDPTQVLPTLDSLQAAMVQYK